MGRSLEDGRKAVSMYVGRDTQALDETGVIKATVETIAENTTDGVIAPMIYMLIGGAPLGFLYKAVNTLDLWLAITIANTNISGNFLLRWMICSILFQHGLRQYV